VSVDTQPNDLADLYEGSMLLTRRLSPRAHERYQQALWYCWGRQDAGDDRTRGREGMGDAFAFAAFAALEAERFERQHVCMLNNIGDQYARFVAV